MDVIKTLCCNCAQSDCGMDVYVDDGRIVKIKGTDGHPYNQGALCPKGFASHKIVGHPDRLMYPMKRMGERGENKWGRVTWDEALDEIADRLITIKKESGPEAFGFFRVTGPGWEGSWFLTSRFIKGFGSPNIATQLHICKVPRSAVTKTMMGAEFDPDFENTDYILIWGSNPANTSLPNLWRRISAARERGAKVVVIDPRFTRSASKADLYTAIKPGTDAALALGLARIIITENLYDKEFVDNYTHGFEEYSKLAMEYTPEKVEEITGISKDVIREIAVGYAKSKPATLLVGNSIEHLTNTMHTMQAIYSLVGLTGNIGNKGGHVLPPGLPWTDMALNGKFLNELLDKSVAQLKMYHQQVPFSMTYTELLSAIETKKPYPIRALLFQGSGGITVMPDTNKYADIIKKNVELNVVHNQWMTPEAAFADFMLPAANFLECSRVRFMRPGFRGSAYMQYVGLQRKVVEPTGESMSDEDLFIQLAKRLGMEDLFPWKDALEATDALVEPLGLTLKDLEDNPDGILYERSEEQVIGSYKKNGFATPTKKFEFSVETFKNAGYEPLPVYEESELQLSKEYPLLGNAGLKPLLSSHTSFHNVDLVSQYMPDPWVELNPETAASLGVEDGEMVEVASINGAVQLKAVVTEGVMPNLALVAYGWTEMPGNKLTSDEPNDPISLSAAIRAFPCRVNKLQ